eukprot:5538132-Amphidinium_carterae.1
MKALPWEPRLGDEVSHEIADAAPSFAVPDQDAFAPLEPDQEYNEEAALRRVHTEECRQWIITSIKNDPEEMEQLRLRRPQGI